MITPTTKKLPKKLQYAALDKNGTLYTPLFDDEEFFSCPRIPFLYVSQYARFIRTYKKATPLLLSPYYEVKTGYTTLVVTVPKRKNGKKSNRLIFGVHDLVAKVWCEYPNFLDADEPTQTHHLIKVKKNLREQPIFLNFAENLKVVYEKYHKILDTTRSLKVATYNGNWKSMKSIEDIGNYYNIPVKDIYDLLLDKPTYVAEGLEYYEIDGNKSIEVRKYKSKSKKKPKKKN